VSITADHDQEQLAAGQMLGRYELLVPIANGGMGTVWAARLKGTRGFRKLLAIKTILRSFESAESQQMLLREATLASQIHHPNVAETLELGEQDGFLYLVMELVSGESLSFILREAQALGGVPLPIAVNLIGQVCQGLQAAHDLCDENGQRIGLIHRDISPPNVLVTDSGTVKIVDFGVATTTSSATYGSGEIKGKISYLAPEQLRGEPLDERVDVFTTGILLYLLTVGQHPFRAAGEIATISRLLSDVPAAAPSSLVPDYPQALEAVVLRALDKHRDTRFRSAHALLEALQQAWPEAFGPRADEAVSAYVRELMRERSAERRARLRLAEELAEKSGSRDSVRSVTAVVTPTASPPSRAPHRLAKIGVAALCLGVGSAAAAVPAYLNLRQPEPVPLAVAPAAAQLSELPRRSVPTAAPETAPASSTAGPLAPIPSPSAAAERIAESNYVDRVEPRLGVRSAGSVEAFAAKADEESGQTGALPDGGLDAMTPAPEDLPRVLPARATIPVVAALIPSRAIAPEPAAPRTVPSKIGHGLLRINPNADPYRVRPPGALDRSGQAFQATVKVCVAESGNVSNVTVLRSAGPAIDAQLREVLSRWRYRPWVQAGENTPFCYTLAYQISH
jgi:eukaryotic-like serine/threonine-protein kinase